MQVSLCLIAVLVAVQALPEQYQNYEVSSQNQQSYQHQEEFEQSSNSHSVTQDNNGYQVEQSNGYQAEQSQQYQQENSQYHAESHQHEQNNGGILQSSLGTLNEAKKIHDHIDKVAIDAALGSVAGKKRKLDPFVGIFGVRSHNQLSDYFYKYSGFRERHQFMSYLTKETYLQSPKEIFRFLKACKGNRGWRFYDQMMTKLAGTTHLTSFLRLLQLLTGKSNPNEAFDTIKSLTGHDDIEGVWEMLQRISSRKNMADVLDCYEHEAGHAEGTTAATALDGVEILVNKMTAGEGPAALPGIALALKTDPDWDATFNSLMGAMRCNEMGEAPVEFKHLLNEDEFSKCIWLIKEFTGLTNFRYAIEQILQDTGRFSLKEVILSLYRITGENSLDGVLVIVRRLFKVRNITELFQRINNMTRRRDPLQFLISLMDVTQQNRLEGACADITALSSGNSNALDILELIQSMSGHEDISDFLTQMVKITGMKCLGEGWRVMISVTKETDIFSLINRFKIYTHTDMILCLQTLLRITNALTLPVANTKINKLLCIDGFFEWFDVIYKTVSMDVIQFFELFTTLDKRLLLDNAVARLLTFTEQTSFIPALNSLSAATGHRDIPGQIAYIKDTPANTQGTTSAPIIPAQTPAPPGNGGVMTEPGFPVPSPNGTGVGPQGNSNQGSNDNIPQGADGTAPQSPQQVNPEEGTTSSGQDGTTPQSPGPLGENPQQGTTSSGQDGTTPPSPGPLGENPEQGTTPSGQDGTTPQSPGPLGENPEQGTTSSGQDGTTPQSPGPLGENPEQGTTSSGQDGTTPQSPGPLGENPQQGTTPSGQDGTTPQSPGPLGENPEQGSTPSGQDRTTPQSPGPLGENPEQGTTPSGQDGTTPQSPGPLGENPEQGTTSSGQDGTAPQSPGPLGENPEQGTTPTGRDGTTPQSPGPLRENPQQGTTPSGQDGTTLQQAEQQEPNPGQDTTSDCAPNTQGRSDVYNSPGSGPQPTAPGQDTYIQNIGNLQALQTVVDLQFVILPRGPKNTKNCYCTCQSPSPPKLIKVKDLPRGIY